MLDGASSGGLASGNSFDGSWMASSMVFATTTAAVREARGVRDNRRGRERLQGEEHELSATVRFGSALAPWLGPGLRYAFADSNVTLSFST